MSLDDLGFALKNFQDGVQQIAVNNAVSSASQQAQQIQQSQMDGMQKQGALQNLGNMLALHLSGTNMPSDKIAQAFSAVSGPQSKTADDMYVQSQKDGDNSLMQAGQQKQQFDAQPAIAQAKLEQANKLQQINATGQNQLADTRLKNSGEANVANIKASSEDKRLRFEQMKQEDQDFGHLSTAIDANKARAGNLGSLQAKYDQGNALKTLVGQYKGNLPDPQMTELAIGYAKMLSPTGQISQDTIHEIKAQSAKGTLNKYMSYITNQPLGSDQQSFVNNLMEGVQREQDTAKASLADHMYSTLGGADKLRYSNPERFATLLHSKGLSLKTYDDIMSRNAQVDQKGGTSAAAVPPGYVPTTATGPNGKTVKALKGPDGKLYLDPNGP